MPLRSLSQDLLKKSKPHSLWKSWKSINLHNLLSGALRKPPSRAEFSKGTWFLMRLSLKLLKNHILFGNGLWKARFENSALRKPPSRAEFSKRKWFLGRLSLNLLKNHILFGNRLWKVRFENTEHGDLRKPPSQAEFSKGMWFLRRFRLNLLKNHILFGNRLWKVQMWKWCIEKTTHKQKSQKDYV